MTLDQHKSENEAHPSYELFMNELSNEQKVFPEKQWDSVHERLNQFAQKLESSQIADYILLLNRPYKLIWTNILAGTARGIGIAIGVTFFTAFIVYALQKLGALNIPIIGDYIAEIVRIVQYQLENRRY